MWSNQARGSSRCQNPCSGQDPPGVLPGGERRAGLSATVDHASVAGEVGGGSRGGVGVVAGVVGQARGPPLAGRPQPVDVGSPPMTDETARSYTASVVDEPVRGGFPDPSPEQFRPEKPLRHGAVEEFTKPARELTFPF